MDTTDSNTTTNAPEIPPEVFSQVIAPRAPDAPRRCFICLTDQDPSDPPSSWVDPCPCTLEAHQDCMLSWITDCERSNKPFQCPVCKAPITTVGPWNPVVDGVEAITRRFSKASPYLLLTGFTVGVQVSAQLYGAMAMWAFAGKEALFDFMVDPGVAFQSLPDPALRWSRVTHGALLMNVAPTLLLSHLLPGLSNKLFVPAASFYAMYHVAHDQHFLAWPPSPQLVMTIFPCVRAFYYNMWREFVSPYEVSLNRQLLGLPPTESGPRRGPNGELWERGPRPQQQNNEGGGGMLGILQNLLDALDIEDDEGGRVEAAAQLRIVQEEVQPNEDGEGGEIVYEIVIEEGLGGDEDDDNGSLPDLVDVPPLVAPLQPEEEQQQPPAGDAEPNANEEEGGHFEGELELEEEEHIQAPPAGNQLGIGAILNNFSNAIVSALLLPGISFAAGEALRLLLPSRWTTSAPFSHFRRPGLLQQQWGRSLVGGCIYVVMKDVLRVYAKHRKLVAMGSRRVKNVDRPRRHKK